MDQPAAPTSPPRPVRFLYIYSQAPQDEELRKELEAHLTPLRRQGLMVDWHRGMAGPGVSPRQTPAEKVAEADVILLLVSADLLASRWYEQEVEPVLIHHASGAARVIPIWLRPTHVGSGILRTLQGLPQDGVTISEHPDRDAAWVGRGARAERYRSRGGPRHRASRGPRMAERPA